ncbi:parvulin-like peptidyl-prolyl isomerase [Synechococcus sp. PCC 7502]|uniref:peptidylprolyl isomerase n=1 Tax=Synechococcus sp. PCC 7502 TaxID=1173263 RepID=UPI00029FC422|nr:peptidylprolyl isomerase [Synechococcus sp. PCC 7502]AFY73020.1 parvulin-like peptidyl-prolyl isomerase [Synechococcus sp. PCC 7502]
MPALEVDGQKFQADQIVEKILDYGMIRQLIKEILLDRCTADIQLTAEEQNLAQEQVRKQLGIDKLEVWLKQQGMTQAQLDKRAERSLKLTKFKQAKWSAKVNSAFLESKSKLDQVIYSLIRTKDFCTAQELYFRINEGEQSFDQLAREYSQGSEAQTGGLVGPCEFRVIHPTLQKILLSSDLGQVQFPTVIDEWIVIVRLEKIIPATLDTNTQQRIIDEKFSQWLEESLNQQMITLIIRP